MAVFMLLLFFALFAQQQYKIARGFKQKLFKNNLNTEFTVILLKYAKNLGALGLI